MSASAAQNETKSELLQDWTQYMLLAIKFLTEGFVYEYPQEPSTNTYAKPPVNHPRMVGTSLHQHTAVMTLAHSESSVREDVLRVVLFKDPMSRRLKSEKAQHNQFEVAGQAGRAGQGQGRAGQGKGRAGQAGRAGQGRAGQGQGRAEQHAGM
ncbi:MAG: hypothetical protein FRX49_07709 [Trebouxia sp. A1-2]|nr:MAG: hypothetical protein FRX49_07709 [Trebouxia sp. A1-2]